MTGIKKIGSIVVGIYVFIAVCHTVFLTFYWRFVMCTEESIFGFFWCDRVPLHELLFHSLFWFTFYI